MSRFDRPSLRLSWLIGAVFAGWLVSCDVAASQTGLERSAAPQTDVWLVTYGPGDLYWQRFGHNAIWVEAPHLGLDHTFNFGFFDFAQEHFFHRFLMGRMLYFSAAQPSSVEFAQYVAENRGIVAQKLDMTHVQKEALVSELLAVIRPENRDYLYDYYLDNCSTRVRDALDRALDGALGSAYRDVPAPLDRRDHTRRLTSGDFWLYLGLELALGRTVDKEIDRWEEMFLPGELYQGVAELDDLVIEERVLYESTLVAPPLEPDAHWLRYLVVALGAVVLAWLTSRIVPAPLIARAWLSLCGLAGLALVFFWFGTDHAAATKNMNVLVFNPLFLLGMVWKASDRHLLQGTVLFSVAAWALGLGGSQYNVDVVAAFVPLNLAAAWVLHRRAESRAAP
ncbi:MAG: DUF4105 domain-containing protein [Gammaproteobacteria bacterium]|nr:DUF4105 domain-containing protein [Gammaproteobacteria bacterium]MBT8051304.1 DUF4105 domain-containing protein [Gammaproteobacteria bacterium]NNJ79262.1 DUF4105 domain-containing protein [Xanthomonadales bacterium]